MTEPAAPRDIAVIDIGSNSVRMVFYRLEGGALWTVFNEKVLAGLGRDLPTTGRLSADGVETALAALRRFSAVLEGVRPDRVLIAATAAVREAADGPAFCERAAQETGLVIRVLSGEEEARYAALGVVAGSPDARGVAADMGGSSLELTRLNGRGAEHGITLPLGPFALAGAGGFDPDRLRKRIDGRLKAAADFRTPALHAVGGAWRALAQLNMSLRDYPLRVVHQYVMTAEEALETAATIVRHAKGGLERLPEVSRRRAETLPYAALVLERLIRRLDVERIEMSAWGVREGLVFEALEPSHALAEPLLAGSAALGGRQGVSPDLPAALERWVAPAAGALPEVFGRARDAVLTRAACMLADIGARLHPDHRVELTFDQVLRAPVAGQTHAERAFLASVINARYGGPPDTPESRTTARLLDARGVRSARALGLAIRLACDLSGRSPHILAHTGMTVAGGVLTLQARPGYTDVLLGDQTRRRARALAEAMGLKLSLGSA